MKKITLLLITILFSCLFAPAQTEKELILDKGVAPHAGIDDIYRRFSEAYRKLDAEAVTNLYTDDAFYLSPGSPVERGREKILANFSGFFNAVKTGGGSLTISFRILERRVSGDLGYDVGIYTLAQKRAGAERSSQGKFVVITTRMKNGEWRFHLDTYSDLPNTASNNQKQQSGENVSPSELQTIRYAIEAQYAKLAEALKNKNFEAFQALRTADFSTVSLSGEPQTPEQMAARARLLLDVIQSPIEAGFEILNVNPRSAEAVVVTIRQRFSRMQNIAGKARPVATAVTQDETWVKTPGGEWKLKFVENEKDLLRIIDCKRVQPGVPYDPNMPPYNPPTSDPPVTEKDWKAFSGRFSPDVCPATNQK